MTGKENSGLFRLASGREVFLVQLRMSLTYSGCLEGTPETNSRHIRERLKSDMHRMFAPNKAVVCIRSKETPLPGFMWAAEFVSHKAVRADDPDLNSRLCICWFSNTIPSDLMRFLQDSLDRIDWEGSAEDYDLMP